MKIKLVLWKPWKKDDCNRSAAQSKHRTDRIRKKAACEYYDSEDVNRVSHNNKKAINAQNLPRGSAAKTWEIQGYCILCKESVITECKYISHSSANCFVLKKKS